MLNSSNCNATATQRILSADVPQAEQAHPRTAMNVRTAFSLAGASGNRRPRPPVLPQAISAPQERRKRAKSESDMGKPVRSLLHQTTSSQIKKGDIIADNIAEKEWGWAATDCIKDRVVYSSERGNTRLTEAAKRVVDQYDTVNVDCCVGCFKGEHSALLWTLGDENANIAIARRFAALGVPRVNLRLGLRNEDGLNLSPELARVKCALLLPGFDPKDERPQTVKVGNCDICITSPEDVSYLLDMDWQEMIRYKYGCVGMPEEKEDRNGPLLSASFGAGYTDPKKVGDCSLLITTYQFGGTRTGYKTNEGVKYGAPGSLGGEHKWIPEAGISDIEIAAQGGEKMWLEQRCNPEISEQLANLWSLFREGKVHIGVMYGLHHGAISEKGKKNRILRRWAKALENKKNQDLPTIIIMTDHGNVFSTDYDSSRGFPSVMPDHYFHYYASIENYGNILELLSNGRSDQSKIRVPHLCRSPGLPKDVFQRLIDNSDLPMLVEGSNTTSYLLATGHPYLSVVPLGYTKIPKGMSRSNKNGMGYSEESQRIKELSYRLGSNYHYKYKAQTTAQYKAYVAETIQMLSGFIDDCLDKKSRTREHFALQQHHMKQAFNDSVVMALLEAERVKKNVTLDSR